jgi:lipopolysaccharide/colanic/teichoic acid biosynthesis glycosyltransferase
MYQPVGFATGKALYAPVDIDLVPLSYARSIAWPISGWRHAAKRGLDVIGSLLVLAVFAVPMAMAALIIRRDSPGAALFPQLRIGFGSAGFVMWKFRTMQQHAPEADRLMQAKPHDQRVTRVGAFLRRHSLDELPQLFNVLRGEMSLVGPRPHAPGTCAGGVPFEMVTPFYQARHRVLPGMTGLAQVRGLRGETDTREKLLRRLEADLEYIENWSLWLDVSILMRTFASVFTGRNAY